jgi:SAM-dependent methyltransferase
MNDWKQWRKKVDLGEYDARWHRMAEAGENPHGEADFVDDVLSGMRPATVLDAGCGTGRVAIELAGRGLDTVGVDLDDELLARARAKAPEMTWQHADLADLDLGRTFDVVVMAGNVVPFVEPARRAAAVAGCARHVGHSGRLVAGFQLQVGWPTPWDYDGWCGAVGLVLEGRFASWDEKPFHPGADYVVSVHRWPEPADTANDPSPPEPPDEPPEHRRVG